MQFGQPCLTFFARRSIVCAQVPKKIQEKRCFFSKTNFLSSKTKPAEAFMPERQFFWLMPEIDQNLFFFKSKFTPLKCFYGHVEFSFANPPKNFKQMIGKVSLTDRKS